jgi:hypothetical protein
MFMTLTALLQSHQDKGEGVVYLEVLVLAAMIFHPQPSEWLLL